MFRPNNSIIGKILFWLQFNNIVITSDGVYYKATYDTKNGGDCKIIEKEKIEKEKEKEKNEK